MLNSGCGSVGTCISFLARRVLADCFLPLVFGATAGIFWVAPLLAQTCGFNDAGCGENKPPVIAISPGTSTVKVSSLLLTIQLSDDFKLDSTSFSVKVNGTTRSVAYNRVANGIDNMSWGQLTLSMTDTVTPYVVSVTIADNQGLPTTASVSISYRPPPTQAPPVVTLSAHHNELRPGAPCGGCTAGFTFASPAYVSRDAPRSVALQYSSATAAPMGLVMLDATMTSLNNPTALSLKLWNPANSTYRTLLSGGTQVFYGASSTRTTRLVAQYDASGDTTGAYPMTAEVRAHYGADSTKLTTISVTVLIVNEQVSPLGVGVAWVGVPRLILTPTGILLSQSDGSAAHYIFTSCNLVSCGYTPPVGAWAILSKDLPNNVYTLTGRDGTVHKFTYDGYLSRVKNRFGDSTTFTWNGSHQLTAVTDAALRKDSITYAGTGVGALTGITDVPGGRQSVPTYNTDHRLTRLLITGSDTTIRDVSYFVTSLQQIKTVTNSDRDTTRYSYDAFGWVRTATLAHPGAVATMTDSVLALPTITQPSAGRGTSLSTTDPGIVPDSAWHTLVGPTGIRTRARTDRFALPLVFEVRAPSGSLQRTKWQRDSAGRVVTVLDPRGLVTVNAYLTGRPMPDSVHHADEDRTFGYARFDQLLWVRVNGTEVSRSYYPTDSLRPDSTKEQGATTRFTWESSKSRPLTVTAPNSQVTTWTYQGSGARNTSTVTAPGGRTTTYGYDAVGRLTSVRDPMGHRDSTVYDALNRATRLESPYLVLNQGWNAATHTDSVVDPLNQSYKSIRDPLGRYVVRVDPRGQKDSVVVDPFGLDSMLINRSGQSVTLRHDGLGRDTIRMAVRDTSRFMYDTTTMTFGAPNGRWFAIANGASRDSTWLDAEGRPTRTRSRRGTRRFEINWEYDVDMAGIRQFAWGDSVTPNRGTQTVTYDGQYRVSTLAATSPTRATGFTYSSTTGQLATMRYPNGASGYTDASVAFTPVEQLSSLAFSTTAVDTVLGRLYTYDLDGRRTSIQKGTSDNSTVRTVAYDSAGRLKAWADSTHVLVWEYVCLVYDPDPFAIISCLSWGYQSHMAHTPLRTDGYTYDAVGNMTNHASTIDPAKGNRYTSFNGYTLTYDARGNLLTKSKSGWSQSYAWNGLGQLDTVKTVTTGTVVTTFRYNAAGLRVQKSSGGVATQYVLNGDQVVAEVDSATGNTIREYQYYPGTDRPHAVRASGKTYYYAYEEPGHVVGLIDTAGTVVAKFEYEPFGVAVSTWTLVAQPFRYAARELDSETGLYYNRARYYDPELMRFISEDPIGLAGGINRYAYVLNTPVNAIDPTGLRICFRGDPGEIRILQILAEDVTGSSIEITNGCVVLVSPSRFGDDYGPYKNFVKMFGERSVTFTVGWLGLGEVSSTKDFDSQIGGKNGLYPTFLPDGTCGSDKIAPSLSAVFAHEFTGHVYQNWVNPGSRTDEALFRQDVRRVVSTENEYHNRQLEFPRCIR